MQKKYNYKGGGLKKLEQRMSSFPSDLGAQKDKKGLGCTWSTIKSLGLIKFVSQCNLIELSDKIDEDLWIDAIFHLNLIIFLLMMLCLNTWGHILSYLSQTTKYIHIMSLVNMDTLGKKSISLRCFKNNKLLIRRMTFFIFLG